MKVSAKKQMVAAGRRWRRVYGPKPWRPRENEVLIGEFIGTKAATGKFGAYCKYLIKVGDQIWAASGTVCDSLFTGLAVAAGEVPIVRLVYKGMRGEPGASAYRDYELYVEVGKR